MRYALPFTVLSFAFVLSGQAFAADIDWSKSRCRSRQDRIGAG